MFKPVFLIAFAVSLVSFATPVHAANEDGRVTASAGGRLGVSRFRPNRWGVVAVDARNSTKRDARVLVFISARGESGQQYGRMLWVPAGAARYSFIPLRLSPKLPIVKDKFELESVIWNNTNDKPQLIKDSSGRIRRRTILSATKKGRITAYIGDVAGGENGEIARQAVAAAHYGRFHDSRLATFAQMLPPNPEALDNVDYLVVFNDRIADDPAALTSIRQWVQNGGRLWIMLDRVRSETVARLLGDSTPFEEVGRVSLTDVKLQSRNERVWEFDRAIRSFEQPVPFVRTLASNVTVAQTVNGWPASFFQEFGRGKILYTTLGMQAWMRRAEERDGIRPPTAPAYVALEILNSIIAPLFKPTPSPAQPQVFEEYLEQQIGYETVGRGTVILVLSIFCVGLMVLAFWLSRRGTMDRMRWAAPGMAVLVAGVLVSLGMQKRHTVPDTIAVIQFAWVEPGAEDIAMTGRLAFYHQDKGETSFEVARGGIVQPDFGESSGTTRKMIWTDLDRWHWQDVTLPAGVQHVSFAHVAKVRQPILAIASFGSQGLSGRLETGPFAEPADAVLTGATPFPLRVVLNGDGTFVAGSKETLKEENFVAGTLLSDEQRRRQSVYRKMLPVENRRISDRPVMLVWTRPVDMGFQWGDRVRTGSALLAIPIRIEATPPATRVHVPAVFLPFRGIRHPVTRAFSTVYSNIEARWNERRGPARNWLRIQVPSELLPLRIERLTVTVHFDGSPRPFEIAGLNGNRSVVLSKVEQPLARTRIDIERPDAFTLDERGGLRIGLFVTENEVKGARWRIKSVSFELQGTTLDANDPTTKTSPSKSIPK